MAETTFNTAHPEKHVREQVEAAVDAYRAMLDAFVNNPMRRAASEAEPVRPRQLQDTPAIPVNRQ